MMKILPRRIVFVLVALSLFGLPVYLRAQLVPHQIKLANGEKFALNLPADYLITPAAEGLNRVRFFSESPDGRIFVTDMHDLTDNQKGKVYVLEDFDAEKGRFGNVLTYMDKLKNPNSVAFYTDEKGQDWFYLAETDKLTRRKFKRGETSPTDSKPETLATFPDYGLSYKYGGWHLTRTVLVGGNGKLYVSVGSSCNSCVETENMRASIVEMNPDGTDQKIYATGLRNAVGMLWLGQFLFVTNQGADHLGKNKPDETFYAPRRGRDYGWPYCYESGGRIYRDPKLRRRSGCRNVQASYAAFPAHSSAMGFDYFGSDSSDELIRDSFLVALHGSTDKSIASGYRVVIMRKDKKLVDFMTGFLDGKTVNGRPLDIFKLSPDSFLLSDDHGGVVYYIRKKPRPDQ